MTLSVIAGRLKSNLALVFTVSLAFNDDGLPPWSSEAYNLACAPVHTAVLGYVPSGEGRAAVRRRVRWMWGGRIGVLLALAALVGCLWYVGLNEAAELASVLGGVAAVAALAAPYVFPPGQKPVAPLEGQPAGSGIGRPGIGVKGDLGSAPSAEPPVTSVTGAGFPHRPTPMVQATSLSVKIALANAIMEFGDIEDPDFRLMVLRSMGDHLGLSHPFSVPYRATARDHVVGIVDKIWEFKDPGAARRALAGALEDLRPDDGATMRLQALI